MSNNNGETPSPYQEHVLCSKQNDRDKCHVDGVHVLACVNISTTPIKKRLLRTIAVIIVVRVDIIGTPAEMCNANNTIIIM